MACLLCRSKANLLIQIFTPEGLSLRICEVISKHFWLKPENNNESHQSICNQCWDVANNFHRLYEYSYSLYTIDKKNHNGLENGDGDENRAMNLGRVKLETCSIEYAKIGDSDADHSNCNGNESNELFLESYTSREFCNQPSSSRPPTCLANGHCASQLPDNLLSSAICPGKPTILNGVFFKVIEDDNSNANSVKAKCVKCEPKTVIIRGSNNSTSNFISHLKRRHGEKVVEEYFAYKRRRLEKIDEMMTIEPIKKSERFLIQQILNDHITNFILYSLLPLRIVESPVFKRIFSNITTLNVLSSTQLRCEIEVLYKRCREKFRKQIALTSNVCMIIDKWLLSGHKLLTVTGHWIESDNLKRKSVLLACRNLKTFEESDDILLEIMKEYEIGDSKFVARLTSNVQDLQDSAIIKLETSSYIEVNGTLDAKPNISGIKRNSKIIECHSNKLNLCARNVLKEVLNSNIELNAVHTSIIEKCKIIWCCSAEMMQIILGETLTATTDFNCWLSLYDSFVQIIKVKDKIPKLVLENNLTDENFLYIQEYVHCFEPLARALNILRSDENGYYGILLPCVLSLKSKVEVLLQRDWKYIKPVLLDLTHKIIADLKDLLSFESDLSKNAVIAAMAYPRFKNKWFSLIESNQQQDLLNLFKSAVIKEHGPDLEENAIVKQTIQKDDDFFDFCKNSTVVDESNSTLAAEVEVVEFLSDIDMRLECLSKYPTIRSIFIKFNTILPSSGLINKLFSLDIMKTLVNSDENNGTLFEKRLILKSNFS